SVPTSRPASATLNPSRASRRAIARPSPRPPPVTTATRWSMSVPPVPLSTILTGPTRAGVLTTGSSGLVSRGGLSMPWRTRPFLPACCLLLALAPSVAAGMASPLPTEPEVYRKVLRLDDPARERLQAISFFVLGLLLCAAAVRWLWNHLQRDFPAL